ncbi:hypothetical protein MMC30_005153 [Trapelia coarctata]|nr:hypothetical protein [Trapelia coarctata]
MDYLPDSLKYDGFDDSMVVECAAEVGAILSGLKSNRGLRTHVVGDIDGRTISSRASTPTVQPEARMYFVLDRRPKSRKTGFRFGSGADVDFQLPKSSKYMGISTVHFRIFVNAHRSWMLADESRSGTKVDDETISSKGRNAARWREIALHPKKPNRIKAASLFLTIYTVGDIEQLGWAAAAGETTTLSNLEDLRIHSQISGSTVPASSVRPTATEKSKSEYHVLRWNRPCMPTDTRRVIHKASGLQGVGKVYTSDHRKERAEQQFADLCIPLKARIEVDGIDCYTIVTTYRQASSLQQLIDEDSLPESSDIMLLYGQIGGGALKWLEKMDIIHRNIRPAVILVDDTRHMSARLTGFSESSKGPSEEKGIGPDEYAAPELKAGRPQDIKVDVYALSVTIRECLSLSHPGGLPDDLQIAGSITKGLEESSTDRPNPSDIYETLHRCVGNVNLPWPPFQSFYVRRNFGLDIVQHDNMRVVDNTGLLTVLYAVVPDSSTLRLTSKSYVSIREAVKLCHDLELRELEDLLMEADHDHTSTVLTYTHEFRVYYHTPTLMLNLTHVLRVLGSAGSIACDKVGRPPLMQEVWGVPEWEGVYVGYDVMEQLFARMPTSMAVGLASEPPSLIENPILGDRFRNIDTEQYIVLTTKFLNPHIILIRRLDCYINVQQIRGDRHVWDSDSNGHESFVSPDIAIATCVRIGLGEVQETIERLVKSSRILDWKRAGTFSVQSGCDCESVKSLETSDSLRRKEEILKAEQELEFHFGRPKESICPPTQHGSGAKQKRFASDDLKEQPSSAKALRLSLDPRNEVPEAGTDDTEVRLVNYKERALDRRQSPGRLAGRFMISVGKGKPPAVIGDVEDEDYEPEALNSKQTMGAANTHHPLRIFSFTVPHPSPIAFVFSGEAAGGAGGGGWELAP